VNSTDSGAVAGNAVAANGASGATSGAGAATTGGATAGGTAGGATGSGAVGGGAGGPNVASDVGVTPTSITIGNVTGINGFLGPEAFGTTLRGLGAFVAYTNSHGGVHGRKLILKSCDDQQDATQNLVCTQKLVQQDKVFGFIANNSLSPQPSAKYEYQQGLPDLGLPLDNGYYKYPNMFSLYGDQSPRDGVQTGDHGLNWNPTAIYRFFKQRIGATKAAFFFYNQNSSSDAAKSQESLAKAEGLPVVYESGGSSGENFAGPTWDTDVQQMKGTGADIIFDFVDVNANQKICAALDRYGITPQIKAKVTTVEGWSQDVGTPAWSTGCRNIIFSTNRTDAYSDTGNPAVKQFVDAFNTYERPQGYTMAQWSLDGWTAGQMFVDYLSQAGGAPTRKGFIQWMDSIQPYTYDAHGLITSSATWWQYTHHPENRNQCFSVAQWQDSAGTFVLRSSTGGGPFYCAIVPELSVPYGDDGS
jgi:ABC-type branched-subunit amino acid transport system substrate-binding protein